MFTEDGKIYELDVDTENGDGSFTTPYKTLLSEDVTSNLKQEDIITVDSTIGWPEINGNIRMKDDEIINYGQNSYQFLGYFTCGQDTVNAPILQDLR